MLDEPWISVVTDKKGNSEKVSMIDFFKNAHLYLDMGGDSRTQDFAVMRVLLAVVRTLFSRVNAGGESYKYFSVDEKFRQLDSVDEFDVDEYEKNLIKTWVDIWKMKKFPEVVLDYLEVWRDRFYIFDEKHPFFQVTKEDLEPSKLSKSKPSDFAGKNINRRISESGNKIALFSPKYENNSNKEILSEDEIARWLITLQGYIGLSDKVIFADSEYKSSKGWLFDLGGIYIKGNNIFETIMLNCVLANKEQNNLESIQTPCWEVESKDLIDKYLDLNGDIYDNEASLMTAWSRAIYINPELDVTKPFVCSIVKLPEVIHQDKFIEQMTIWKHNKTGENRDTHTPRKHQANKSVWRNFGLIAGINKTGEKDENIRMPGVIEWINEINTYINSNKLNFSMVSMQDDANATSWVPTDEVIDSFIISEKVFLDEDWIVRINSSVEKTKNIISIIYKKFMDDIKQIRSLSNSNFSENKVEEMYYRIDFSFREWLYSLDYNDNREERVFEWYEKLRNMVIDSANSVVENASPKDYKGIITSDGMKNIATAYNYFINWLNKEIQLKGGIDDEE